jgi:hypothetical protein
MLAALAVRITVAGGDMQDMQYEDGAPAPGYHRALPGGLRPALFQVKAPVQVKAPAWRIGQSGGAPYRLRSAPTA